MQASSQPPCKGQFSIASLPEDGPWTPAAQQLPRVSSTSSLDLPVRTASLRRMPSFTCIHVGTDSAHEPRALRRSASARDLKGTGPRSEVALRPTRAAGLLGRAETLAREVQQQRTSLWALGLIALDVGLQATLSPTTFSAADALWRLGFCACTVAAPWAFRRPWVVALELPENLPTLVGLGLRLRPMVLDAWGSMAAMASVAMVAPLVRRVQRADGLGPGWPSHVAAGVQAAAMVGGRRVWHLLERRLLGDPATWTRVVAAPL